jgi:hypothetical protein
MEGKEEKLLVMNEEISTKYLTDFCLSSLFNELVALTGSGGTEKD